MTETKVEDWSPPYGSGHYASKLTEEDIRDIRSLQASGITQATLAEQYGVSEMQISRIVRRINWRHVA